MAGNVNESDSGLAIGGHNNLRHTGRWGDGYRKRQCRRMAVLAAPVSGLFQLTIPPAPPATVDRIFPARETRPQERPKRVLFAIRIASSKYHNARRAITVRTLLHPAKPVTPVISMIPGVSNDVPACNKRGASSPSAHRLQFLPGSNHLLCGLLRNQPTNKWLRFVIPKLPGVNRWLTQPASKKCIALRSTFQK